MIELIDANGKKLASGYVVPDGGKIRVPHLMMDAAPPDIEAITKAALADAQKPQALRHSPGQVAPLTDADRATREKALDARDARLVGAWKNPPAVDAAQIEKPAPTTPTGSAADRRDARLEQAWRN